MPIVIHVDLEDQQVKAAVQKAIEGEIVSLTRSSLERIVGQSVSDRVSILLDSKQAERFMQVAAHEYVMQAMTERYGARSGQIAPAFEKIIRDEVRVVLEKYLKPITGDL